MEQDAPLSQVWPAGVAWSRSTHNSHPQQSWLLQTRIRSWLQVLGGVPGSSLGGQNLALLLQGRAWGPEVSRSWSCVSSFLPHFPRGSELPVEPPIPRNCTREHCVHCLVPLPEDKP